MTAALVVGRANCVWDDLDQAMVMRPPDLRYTVIAVNVVGTHLRYIDHWVSFHPELMVNWIRQRRDNDFDDNYQLWTSAKGRRMTEWERHMKIRMIDCDGGSSGMIGVLVALELGIPRIVLAGIPMVNEAGRYDVGTPWDEAEQHKKAWEKLPATTKMKIRSMSGWTRLHFGYPSVQWMLNYDV